MYPQSAFTLIEALIVLSIIAILSLLAFPGLQGMMQRAQDDVLRDEMVRLMQDARAEAMMLRQTVTLCKSSDLQHCGGDWSDGQITFVDTWHDGRIHNTAQILSVNKAQNNRGNLHARFYPVYREVVHFNPVAAEFNDNGTFWYCRKSGAYPAWALQVNRVGSVNILSPNKNGSITDSKGKMLTC